MEELNFVGQFCSVLWYPNFLLAISLTLWGRNKLHSQKMGNEESRVIGSRKEGEDQSGQYAKECGIETAGWLSWCTANSNRRQKFCNQESTLDLSSALSLEEVLLLHVSCYEYEVCIIRRIGVRIKRYVPPLHGSVHPCNGSSPRKAAEGSGYFIAYL
jgi:hypothetical protein